MTSLFTRRDIYGNFDAMLMLLPSGAWVVNTTTYNGDNFVKAFREFARDKRINDEEDTTRNHIRLHSTSLMSMKN